MVTALVGYDIVFVSFVTQCGSSVRSTFVLKVEASDVAIVKAIRTDFRLVEQIDIVASSTSIKVLINNLPALLPIGIL